jgi:hypothetical protein
MLQALNLPASARWRIDPNDLQYGHPRVRLGVGSYGEVLKVRRGGVGCGLTIRGHCTQSFVLWAW